MKIDVYSRMQIENLDPKPNTALVSIGTPQDITLLSESESMCCMLMPGWKSIYRVFFHDMDDKNQHRLFTRDKDYPWVMFDEEMAGPIRFFIETHKSCDFAIHCLAGVSRSVAIGKYIRDVHRGELTLHSAEDDSCANGLVYRTLMRPHWEKQLSTWTNEERKT